MKQLKFILSISLLSSVLFTSCLKSDGDIDTEKPVIKLNAPVEGAKLEAGKDIHFDMDLSDNIALGSYDIDIHSAEGHSHTHGVTIKEVDHDHDHEEDPENAHRKSFKYKNSWDDIYGQRNAHIHHHEIVIDKDAKRGEYHFVVKVLDKAGNQAMEFRTVNIVNPGEGDHEHKH
ncbi:DUF4625 domain-containing protein [Myroides sp. M-43]|uniref:DUF4625 domain-containing protein n=1 Tax=Myroides oncorhynchi TaxID=2893756 RepID=UPI001E2951F9|nr:DUF4625 domain-containing protein [Myroides oncorhynchi]MCC9042424.1 DUF4625 domain-containing protein [Myroides oncorhynchi]